MRVYFQYDGPAPILRNRELLGQSVSDFHATTLAQANRGISADQADWVVLLGETLLFDRSGLVLIAAALQNYQGQDSAVGMRLDMFPEVRRDYYSLQLESALPLKAVRSRASHGAQTVLTVMLPSSREMMKLPASMGGAMPIGVPHALLLPYSGEFDLLFANQIAVLSQLRQEVINSPRHWLPRFWRVSSAATCSERATLAYRRIHSKAHVHPTAIIEGSIIEEGAEIGAHCTVRDSLIGKNARLQDGAKVEFSVVGAGAWLMHDLVLYRCAVEADVFLIHGPYQFSYFQKKSSAFATILMDFRPDQKPMSVRTPSGLKKYEGRFLGSVVGEESKLLGGCLLASGRIVPAQTWLGPDAADIHTLQDHDIPKQTAMAPDQIKRRTDEPSLR